MTKTIFTIYRGHHKGDFYWHAKRKGRIVADSGEGYRRKAACLKSLKALLGSVKAGQYEVVEHT